MKKTFRQSVPAILLFILFGTTVFSQDYEIQKELVESNLYMISKTWRGEVALRWAPTTPELWEAANAVGYHIDRLEIPAREEDLPKAKFLRLTDAPIRPWPAQDWETLTETDDNAAIAYMCIYAEQPSFSGDVFSRLAQQDEIRQKSYFFGMVAADQSAKAAEAMGLRFSDKDIKRNARYIYRIYAAAPFSGSEIKMDTAMLMVNTAEITQPLPPFDVSVVSLEKQVVVKWPTMPNRKVFSTFYVEKSDSPNGPFVRLNKNPILKLNSEDIPSFNDYFKYADTLEQNYVPHYYRVIGTTYFGDESPPSEVVMGMGKDKTPPGAPRIIKVEPNDGDRVEIEWTKDYFEPDFEGYIVARSPLVEGPFTPLHEELLPPISNSFIDRHPNPKGLNFYQITAVDTAGNIAKSFSKYALFVDTFPPEAPQNLTGVIDTNGVVTLDWAANTEPDLKGYRVYFANAADHQFIQISNELLSEPHYVDTISINTLTEEAYYRVVAVDRGSGHSEYSDILELKRPDIIPPSPGLFSNYKVENDKVLLEWVPSTSADAFSQKLYRSSNGKSEVIGEFDMRVNSFSDENIKNGRLYEYTLEVTDDDGLVSKKSFPLNIKITDSKTEATVKNLTARYNDKKQIMELQWDYVNMDGNQRFVIYRSVKGQGLRSYKSVSGTTRFEDMRLREKGKYEYAIRVMSDNGASDLSDPVSASFE